VEQQWNALGALASRVLQQAAEAREESAGQLRNAEAEQGTVAYQRRKDQPGLASTRERAQTSRQLELPLA